MKNELKTALLEILGDLLTTKEGSGDATGFGPIPSSAEAKVYVQNSDSAGVWFTLDADKKRSYIQEPSFTGYVERLDTRDQASSESPSVSRKIDLTMRKTDGSIVTFVFGIMVNIYDPEHNAVAKALLAGLVACTREDLVTIAPSAGDKKFVVLLQVFRNGAPQMNQWGDDAHTAELLVQLMERFGGIHAPLKDSEESYAQPQRSAAPAAPVAKAAATGKREPRATDQQWSDLKSYLGTDDASVANAKELIIHWCSQQYQIKSPLNIPAADQVIALDQCKEYLDACVAAAQAQESPIDFDDIPF